MIIYYTSHYTAVLYYTILLYYTTLHYTILLYYTTLYCSSTLYFTKNTPQYIHTKYFSSFYEDITEC